MKKRRRSRYGPPQPFYSKFHKRWIVRLMKNGKRTERKFKEKPAAFQYATEAWQDIEDGIDSQDMTVRDLVERFMASKSSASPSTLADYGTTLDHVKPLDAVPIRIIRPLQLDELIDSLPTSAARKRLRGYLSMMFRQAVKWELIRRNPVEGTKKQSHRKERAEVFEQHEVASIMEAGKDVRLIGLLDLGFTLGPRPAELLGFQWQDWNEEKGLLSVRRKVAEVQGKIDIGPPKTHAAIRDLRLPDHITERLRDRRVSALKEGCASKTDWIWPSTNGTAMRRSNLRAHIWKPLLLKAGVPYRKPYCMRHTAASTMLNGLADVHGISLAVVSETLGHDNSQITLEVYSHVLKAEHEQVPSFWNRVNSGT